MKMTSMRCIKVILIVEIYDDMFAGSSYLFSEYKYPVDPGAGNRNRAEYARQYGPVNTLSEENYCDGENFFRYGQVV